MKGLKALRLRAGISQQAFAAQLGVTQAALSHWETGDRNPGLEYIRKCRELLGCTYDELIAGVPAENIITVEGGACNGA